MNGTEPETVSWLRIVVAFSLVFGLLGALAYALKYINMKGIKLPGMETKNQRLHVVESLTLDVRRRLVIIRRDDVEHLLLLGANQDIVIESDLKNSPSLSTKSAI